MAYFLGLFPISSVGHHFKEKQNSIFNEGWISFLIAHLEVLWKLVSGHFLNKVLIPEISFVCMWQLGWRERLCICVYVNINVCVYIYISL